jgi:hypothetical protein
VDFRGGGCLAYIPDYLYAEQVLNPTLDWVKDALWLKITGKFPTLLLGCIYRAPNASKTNTLNLIDAFHLTAAMPFKHKLIAGDFNMPDIKWSVPSATVNRTFLQVVNCDG